MKKQDISIIVVVVIVSGFLAVMAAKVLIKPADKKQSVEVVQAITPDFPAPDPRFFNNNAIDPTQSIQIGDNSNTDPFKGAPGL